MADNTAKARKELAGMRKAVADHIEKYQRYVEPYEKQGALKTVQRVQGDIARLKSKHPSLKDDSDRVDTWRP